MVIPSYLWQQILQNIYMEWTEHLGIFRHNKRGMDTLTYVTHIFKNKQNMKYIVKTIKFWVKIFFLLSSLILFILWAHFLHLNQRYAKFQLILNRNCLENPEKGWLVCEVRRLLTAFISNILQSFSVTPVNMT